jgi:hypothetical protein
MATEMTVNGRTLPLWTRKHLESMSPQIMRLRGLDIKDAMGLQGTVPRHKETLCEWILAMQAAVMEGAELPSPAPARPSIPEGYPVDRGVPPLGQVPAPFAMGGSERAAPRSSRAYSEAGSAMTDTTSYEEARTGAMRAKARNQGSGNILSWA